MKPFLFMPAFSLLLCCSDHGAAAVTPNGLFTDHAVLQQDVAVPIWGSADPGEAVTVSLAGQTVATVAADGKWMVHLEPLRAGGPYTLTIAGRNTLTFTDILIGEVWICSGQSNMERALGPRASQPQIENWEQEAASADFPQIRHFGVTHGSTKDLLSRVSGGPWTICTPTTVTGFTAVGFFFGRALHLARKVPIGLLHVSVGGTRVEDWTSRDAMTANPETVAMVNAFDQRCADYSAKLEQWKQQEPQRMAAYQAEVEAARQAGRPLPRKPEAPRDPAQFPIGRHFNAMVAPLIPYAMRGVIWYQGEANSGQGHEYRSLFPTLIADWRTRWGIGDFPFLFVQIAPHHGISSEIREAQFLTLARAPNTAMAVTTDVGDAQDIHPARKRPVGERLALAARALAYGEHLEYSGPLYHSLRIDGTRAVVGFTHADGLLAKDGPLRGLTIAGADGRFVPARAEIRKQTVVVWNDGVTAPVAVRYGWANVPDVNLFNQDGLPASPFRSDVTP